MIKPTLGDDFTLTLLIVAQVFRFPEGVEIKKDETSWWPTSKAMKRMQMTIG
jgi:hypothetical protein